MIFIQKYKRLQDFLYGQTATGHTYRVLSFRKVRIYERKQDII